MTKVSISLITVVLLALVGYVGAQTDPLVHFEFEGDYSNSGTGTVAGQSRGGATIVADSIESNRRKEAQVRIRSGRK